MAEGVQAIVLSEDLQGWVFVRRMLVTLGYEARRIRVIPYPDGRGSGEQHVRDSYPGQLETFRSRAARTRTVLVVHTDADKMTVQERRASLERALEAKAVAPRGSAEAVAVLVPKREIETWIHFFLVGPPVDEVETKYPKYEGHEAEAWPAADAFARHVRGGTQPAGAPPSLLAGLVEARRIP
jgi:hypothetical protein